MLLFDNNLAFVYSPLVKLISAFNMTDQDRQQNVIIIKVFDKQEISRFYVTLYL